MISDATPRVDPIGSRAATTHRHGLSTALAIGLATPIYLLTLTVAVVGVLLLIPGTDLFQKILGVVCLMLAFVLRPAPGAADRDATRVDLAHAPETAGLVREVAGAVGSPAPARVEVTSDPRADLGLAGLGSGVVRIGAPLWLALTGPERIALLGHQLGHLTRGAGRVRRYTDGAIETLARWEMVATPTRPNGLGRHANEAMISTNTTYVRAGTYNPLLAGMVAVILWPVRAAARGYRRLIERVSRPSVLPQARAADQAAVRAGGPEATRALLEVLAALPGLETSANRAVASRSDVAAAIAEWQQTLDAVGRRSLRQSTDTGSVDDRHPPTAQRIAAIGGAGPVEPIVTVPSERWRLIDAELADAVATRLRRFADDYLYPH